MSFPLADAIRALPHSLGTLLPTRFTHPVIYNFKVPFSPEVLVEHGAEPVLVEALQVPLTRSLQTCHEMVYVAPPMAVMRLQTQISIATE